MPASSHSHSYWSYFGEPCANFDAWFGLAGWLFERLVLINELPADAAGSNAAGWEVCLDRLAGLTPSREAWQPRFDVYSAAFTPVLGPQEGPPAGYKGD